MTEQQDPTRSERSTNVTQALVSELEGYTYQATIWRRVVADLKRREAKGIETYGDSLHTFNGRDVNRDLYEELLDALQYAKQRVLETGEGLHAYFDLQLLVFQTAKDIIEEEIDAKSADIKQAYRDRDPIEAGRRATEINGEYAEKWRYDSSSPPAE